jgi:hypothetical protein
MIDVVRRNEKVIAKAEIQGQLRRDFPIVLTAYLNSTLLLDNCCNGEVSRRCTCCYWRIAG